MLCYDSINYILSFLEFNDFIKLNLPFLFFKKYIINRISIKKSDKWIKGIYNNCYNNCFVCSYYTPLTYCMVICISCEILLDNICNYPMLCYNCNYNKEINRGKVLCLPCCCCENKCMHIGITAYS